MAIKKGQQHEVEITGIAFGGKGLTKIDKLAVFVDQAVPGDRASIRVIYQSIKLMKFMYYRKEQPSQLNPS